MRAAVFGGKANISVTDVPDPVLQGPGESIVKVPTVASADRTCGSTAACHRRAHGSATSSWGWSKPSTGHHAAADAHVSEGSTVAVIGDGAVGLCAVAASKRLGAARIFLVSTHDDRAAIGTQFGAINIVAARGDDAVQQIKAATGDLGVDAALEYVGTPQAWNTAFDAVRIGGNVGFVGCPTTCRRAGVEAIQL